MKTTTMRGKPIDFNALMARNPNVPTVGNTNMNARGDIIGPGGKIVKKREQVAADYHRATSKSVKRVAIKDIGGEVLSPAAAIEAMKAQRAAASVIAKHDADARTAQSTPRRKLNEEE